MHPPQRSKPFRILEASSGRDGIQEDPNGQTGLPGELSGQSGGNGGNGYRGTEGKNASNREVAESNGSVWKIEISSRNILLLLMKFLYIYRERMEVLAPMALMEGMEDTERMEKMVPLEKTEKWESRVLIVHLIQPIYSPFIWIKSLPILR